MLQLIIILLWMSRKEAFIANYKHKDYKGEIDQINWGIALGLDRLTTYWSIELCCADCRRYASYEYSTRTQELWPVKPSFSTHTPVLPCSSTNKPTARIWRIEKKRLNKEDKFRAVYVCGGNVVSSVMYICLLQ